MTGFLSSSLGSVIYSCMASLRGKVETRQFTSFLKVRVITTEKDGSPHRSGACLKLCVRDDWGSQSVSACVHELRKV